ncbi:MAG: diacylglycerol kinase family protein [Dehalococcoidia bacterium]|nr:diacylglycerol kinase family protein [Dehalococcoidia bacterium]
MGLVRRVANMRYAVRGCLLALREEPNVLLEILGGLVLLTIALIRGITATALTLLVLALGMLIAAELFNSAVERLADRVQPERDPAIGAIKDIASGAVFVVGLAGFVAWVMLVFR